MDIACVSVAVAARTRPLFGRFAALVGPRRAASPGFAGLLIVLCFAGGCKRAETPSAGATAEDGVSAPQSPASGDEASGIVPDDPDRGGEAAYVSQKPTTGRFHDVHTHLNALGAAVTLELLDGHGVDRIVNLSGGSAGRASYENSLQVVELTKGRVVPFFNIDWTRIDEENFGENIATDLQTAVEAGFGGLKISKALGLNVERADGTLVAVDDPALDPIFDKAGELGVPIAIHTADPKAFFEPPTPFNERWEELSAHPSWSFYGDEYPEFDELLAQLERRIARHPQTTFICVHFGNNAEDLEYVDRLLDTYPNANIDIAARLGEFGRHEAERTRKLFIEHADRILFGTDFMLYAKQPDDGEGLLVSMILGSSGPDDEPAPTVDDAHRFFDAHWQFLEGDAASMPNPVPIQGRWDIHPLDLPDEVLSKVYLENAERLVFAPWDARHAARLDDGESAPPPPPE